jgi:hypothetical protein
MYGDGSSTRGSDAWGGVGVRSCEPVNSAILEEAHSLLDSGELRIGDDFRWQATSTVSSAGVRRGTTVLQLSVTGGDIPFGEGGGCVVY